MHKRMNLVVLIIVVALTGAAALLLILNRELVLETMQRFFLALQRGALLRELAAGVRGLLLLAEPYFGMLFTLYLVSAGLVLFFENKNPDRTLAWLLALTFLPLLGFLLYLTLGPNFQRRKDFARLEKSGSLPDSDEEEELRALAEGARARIMQDPVARRTVPILLRSGGCRVTARNRLQVLSNGDEKFHALKEALQDARHTIHLEYFKIENDDIGEEIKDILVKKARAGVTVRLLYDGVGSWGLRKIFLKELVTAGVQASPFLPISFPMVRRTLNFRNHRKIAVIDGKIGITGGINIGDNYLGRGPLGYWRDTSVLIEGEAVAELQHIFVRDFEFATRNPIDPAGLYPPHEDDLPISFVQIAASGPDSEWPTIQKGFFALITAATRRLWLATPYFVPDPALSDALKNAALSGVDVRIILPSKVDHHVVHWASMSRVEGMLRAGIRVFSYTKGFLHSKVMLADDAAVSIGTTNLDTRSLEINFEVQAFIYDREVAGHVERDLLGDFRDAEEILLEKWVHRSIVHRFLESSGRLLSSQI